MTAEHAEDSSSIFKIVLNLTITCIISGVIISVVNFFTADIAVAKQAELKTLALKSLVTQADQYTPVEGKTDWFTATVNGKVVAYIVPAESKGYGGAIKMLVAVGPDNKVIKYTILDAKETPGLGDKASKPQFADQFAGKTSGDLKVNKDGGAIQAISGATITSRAVTKAVKEAVDEVSELTKGGK